MSNILESWLLTPSDPMEVLNRLNTVLDNDLAGVLQTSSPSIGRMYWTQQRGFGTLMQVQIHPAYPRHLAEREVEVCVEGNASQPRLSVSCDVCGHQYGIPSGYEIPRACDHGKWLLIKAVQAVRGDVAPHLADPRQLRKVLLSKNAASILQVLERDTASSTKKTIEQPSSDRDTAELTFILAAGNRGMRHSLELVQNGTDGYRRSYRSVPQNWSSFLPVIGGRMNNHSDDPFHSDGVRQRLSQSDIDWLKQVFMAAGLPESSHILVRGTRIGTTLLQMAEAGKLRASSIRDEPLRQSEPRQLMLAWQRDPSLRWQLVMSVEGGGDVIPCIPPLFVQSDTGEIGLLADSLAPEVLDVVTFAAGLSDEDLITLRQRANGRQITGLPNLPEVEVIDGGVLRPVPTLLLDWRSQYARGSQQGTALADVDFDYDGTKVRHTDGKEISVIDGLKRIDYQRDLTYEAECVQQIRPRGKAKKGDNTLQVVVAQGEADADKVVKQVREYHKAVVPTLKEAGWRLQMSDGWQGGIVPVTDLDYTIKPAAGGTYDINVSADVEGTAHSMVHDLVGFLGRRDVLAAILENQPGKTFELPATQEGYRPIITRDLLAKILPLFTLLTHEDKTNTYRMRTIDFGALDAATRDTDSRLDGGEDLAKLATSLSVIPENLPQSTLTAMTIPPWQHQARGALWCGVRRKHGFGAIIGDEYATGKTLQSLVTLHTAWCEPEAENHRVSLIIVSKTLYYERRWQEDADKFFHDMRLVEVPNSKGMDKIEALEGTEHAVITTYDTLVRNLNRFLARQWNVIACDEGHKLGNSLSTFTKAVGALQARQKLIITGSAMQNSAREMWSVMTLAVPGLLREKAWFNRTFPKNKLLSDETTDSTRQSEITQANRAKLVALGKLISPFYLRRLNAELGRSLPTVTEVRHSVVFGKEQAAVYESIRALQHAEVRKAIAESGLAKSHLFVLEAIERLRQICDHPQLVNVKGVASAKLEALNEICTELLSEGKRIVITSHFTNMLKILEQHLEETGISSVRISGGMSGPARKKSSEKFRSGEVSIILIQLSMAEGIELPEGDAIVLFEPWWNAKKEEQAIARLRRDERDKHVTILRLVVSNSVEEGVLKIAAKKLADIEAVHEGHASAGGTLTLDDIEEFFRPLSDFIDED
ncbi:DEAD/DEAH box helicase [Duganella vulcania]|uniref:DEAD/DEAH box helicase n=1 Tax=Duganella vulcania TaxID=2692166 RepID=A0A845GG99_9BURK|nr:DEAD/DEAH box helicase [Duganella vulcania]MYM92432.1 hypothetical protein [Duganella vulcania]